MNPNNELAPTDARFAVLFSPAIGSPWWAFGSRWLGRCAFTGQTFTRPVIENMPEALHERLIAGPRRQGLHAALKAPFELAPNINAAILQHGIDAIARYGTQLRFHHFESRFSKTFWHSCLKYPAWQ